MASRARSLVTPPDRRELSSRAVLRVVIISLILLGGALFSLAPSDWILVMLVAASGFLVIWQTPQLGLIALLPASMVIPAAIATNSRSSVNITMLMIGVLSVLWILKSLLRDRRITFGPPMVMTPLFVFVGVATLAFVVGQLRWFSASSPAPLSAQLGGLAVFLLSAAAFTIAANQITNLRWLKILTWIFLTAGTLYVVGRALPSVGHYALPHFQSGATGSVFWIWLVALSVSQALFNDHLRWVWRAALGTVAIAALLIALGPSRSWVSGWLPPLVAALVVLWAAKPRLALLITAAVGAVILLNLQETIGILLVNEEYSVITRREAWRIVIDMVQASPLLGFGPANYRFYAAEFPILGWNVPFNSHNQYVDLVAQTGVLGLGAFIWLMWAIGRIGWRKRNLVPEGFARAFVYGSLGGLVGILVTGMLADWVLPFVYNITLSGMRSSVIAWVFLGALVGMDQVSDDSLVTGQSRLAFASSGRSIE